MQRTKQQIEEERKRMKVAYGTLFDQVVTLFYRHDPIGINFGDNADEYDPEARTVLPRLSNCHSVDDVQRAVQEEFVRWFGADNAGSIERYRGIAEELWPLWQEWLNRY